MSEGCLPTAASSSDQLSPADLIRYIDESGSSSCASSLLGDGPDTTASLSHLLDGVGSEQFSIDALDDIAVSCGYGSLDTRSETGSDTKLGPSKWRRTPKITLSENALASDGEDKRSLERQRKVLRPCGEYLMRRSLGSGEVYQKPDLNCVSLPGSTTVSPKSKYSEAIHNNNFINNNNNGRLKNFLNKRLDDRSSKSSSHQSYHTSLSSIKSSDNILDDTDTVKAPFPIHNRFLGDGSVEFKCSSPLMPPQCTPPPIPAGESSYVTSASSTSSLNSYSTRCRAEDQVNKRSSLISDSVFLKESFRHNNRNTRNGNPVPERLQKSISAEDVSLKKENSLLVPLADMDDFSETKDVDHSSDTLESGDKIEKHETNPDKDISPPDTENPPSDVDPPHEKTDVDGDVDVKSSPSPTLDVRSGSPYDIKYGKIVVEDCGSGEEEVISVLENEEKPCTASISDTAESPLAQAEVGAEKAATPNLKPSEGRKLENKEDAKPGFTKSESQVGLEKHFNEIISYGRLSILFIIVSIGIIFFCHGIGNLA